MPPTPPRRISSAIRHHATGCRAQERVLEGFARHLEIEARALSGQAGALDVSQNFFEEAYSLLRPLASEKGIDLSFQCRAWAPQIKATLSAFVQVLST